MPKGCLLSPKPKKIILFKRKNRFNNIIIFFLNQNSMQIFFLSKRDVFQALQEMWAKF